MSVNNKHPTYTAQRLSDWRVCRDAYDGEGSIKARGEEYLPMPSGYLKQKDRGLAAYAAYKMRAQFPDIMAPSVAAMIGIIHDKEISVEIPDALEFLHENADGEGATLVDFHREITRQLLVTGRYGVLADAPIAGGNPYLAGYFGETIINWDADFYVLDESEVVRSGFVWDNVEKYRVLELEGSVYRATTHVEGVQLEATPKKLGGGVVSRLPFVVASAKDMGADIESPPMIGIARAAKAIYQLSADYRLQLFMSGQETLAAINAEAPEMVGAGVVVQIRGTEGLPADLKYVSPSCSGIDAHLVAMKDNRDTAIQAGARLFEQAEQGNESGAARKLRFRSESANLRTIAQSSCSLLEKSLRNVAMLMGLPDATIEAITVNPPKDLMDATMTPDEAAKLWQLVLDGGLSSQTYFERILAGGIASDERDYDEEFSLIGADRDRADGLLTEGDDLLP